ncbi:hypothetical protein GOP47_0021864 [Adiantum capillus-veneris]|uniref:Uncharacterized protein n=1 Tax=Adiantum capillus-veneris TaxID=13818 RepID=A0A9D4U8L9_ADICA|nr:hypothetical protein GOP47_0021864 [Adiantum capillus-veneris]
MKPGRVVEKFDEEDADMGTTKVDEEAADVRKAKVIFGEEGPLVEKLEPLEEKIVVELDVGRKGEVPKEGVGLLWRDWVEEDSMLKGCWPCLRFASKPYAEREVRKLAQTG